MLQLAWPVGIFLVSLTVLLSIRAFVRSRLRRRAAAHRSSEVLLDAISLPSVLWCLAIALAAAIEYSNLTPKQETYAIRAIEGFLVLGATFVAAAVAVRLITGVGERRQIPFVVAGLSRTLTYIVIVGIGILTLFTTWGINITPLLTALGVGGLAVALALQDTLANLFAGIQILIENPIAVGEFIKLSSGEEGTVRDIGWRTTRIQTGTNNTIVVPNTKITTSILTNFSLPDRRTMLDVIVVAGLDADLAMLERVCLEEAQATPGVLPDSPAVFLFEPGVLPTHLQAKIACMVENRLQQGPVAAAIRVRLLNRFRQEGIPLARLNQEPKA